MVKMLRIRKIITTGRRNQGILEERGRQFGMERGATIKSAAGWAL
jgi:hypothetical protein